MHFNPSFFMKVVFGVLMKQPLTMPISRSHTKGDSQKSKIDCQFEIHFGNLKKILS